MSIIPLFFIVVVLFLTTIKAGTSRLWGTAGELWDPKGRLPDYSYAGYHAGEEPLPNLPVVNNALDFGAKPDGVTDNTTAFANAIAATNNGALLIPKGRYLVNSLVSINKNNVVLRGEGPGPDGTILYFPRHLTTLLGGTDRAPWKYGQGGLVWVGKPYRQSAIGSQLASVTAGAVRGDTWLTLSTTSGISAGMYVALRITDTADNSFSRHLHNGLAVAASASMDWYVKVKSVSGGRVELYQPLRFNVEARWQPRIYGWSPVTECGLEDIRIEFPDVVYPGLLAEHGYNGVAFNHTLNCWMKNVDIKCADNGFSLENSKHVTCRDWRVLGRSQGTTGAWVDYHGHHVLDLNSNACDNLLTDFAVPVIFFNSLTVSHRPSGNVIQQGIGRELQLDHHKYNPFENLYCNIHVGKTTLAYFSGGPDDSQPHSAARGTFWNNYNALWTYPTSPPWDTVQTNVIPCETDLMTADRQWLEKVDGLEPVNLYYSQLGHRIVVWPTIQPAGGTYTGRVLVTLSTVSYGAEIRYTTDGTTPTAGSDLYNGPVALTTTGILRARAFRSGQGSRTEQASFTILPDNSAPRISRIYAYNRTLRVLFDEQLDSASASEASHYTVSGGLSVTNARLENSRTGVTLSLNQDLVAQTDYQLTVNGVLDRARPGHATDNLQRSFSVLFYDDFEEGGRLVWTPRTAGRWEIVNQEQGSGRNHQYALVTSDFNPVNSGPGEFSLLAGVQFADFELTLTGYSPEAIYNPSAELAVLFGYRDTANFHYLLLSNNDSYNRLCRVSGGVRQDLLNLGTARVTAYDHRPVIRVRVSGARITVTVDGTICMDVAGEVGAGQLGMGGYNDLACFDEVTVQPLGSLGVPYRWPGSYLKGVPVVCLGPNPGVQKVFFRFQLEKPANVECRIYTIKGKTQQVLRPGELAPGLQNITWGPEFPLNGIYLYRVMVGKTIYSGQVVLVK